MTLDELEDVAMAGGTLPKELGTADTWLFLCLRSIYKAYRSGVITRSQGKAEKVKLMIQYRSYLQDEESHLQRARAKNRTAGLMLLYDKKPTLEVANQIIDLLWYGKEKPFVSK